MTILTPYVLTLVIVFAVACITSYGTAVIAMRWLIGEGDDDR